MVLAFHHLSNFVLEQLIQKQILLHYLRAWINFPQIKIAYLTGYFLMLLIVYFLCARAFCIWYIAYYYIKFHIETISFYITIQIITFYIDVGGWYIINLSIGKLQPFFSFLLISSLTRSSLTTTVVHSVSRKILLTGFPFLIPGDMGRFK